MNKFDILFEKIMNPDDTGRLDRMLAFWRFRQARVVFTNGCFDVLHRGHVEYLAKAASLGDVLIVGLNTDESVSRLKGEGRPVNPMEARAVVLSALSFVNMVIPFPDDTPYNLIAKVQPDFLVKGSDYKPEEIVGYDIVTNKGGSVVTIKLVDGFSTTSILTKMG